MFGRHFVDNPLQEYSSLTIPSCIPLNPMTTASMCKRVPLLTCKNANVQVVFVHCWVTKFGNQNALSDSIIPIVQYSYLNCKVLAFFMCIIMSIV